MTSQALFMVMEISLSLLPGQIAEQTDHVQQTCAGTKLMLFLFLIGIRSLFSQDIIVSQDIVVFVLIMPFKQER